MHMSSRAAKQSQRPYPKALVITHELSGVENRDLHLTQMFAPYPLYYVLGRSAAAEPKCPTRQCLWFTWRDTLSHLRH